MSVDKVEKSEDILASEDCDPTFFAELSENDDAGFAEGLSPEVCEEHAASEKERHTAIIEIKKRFLVLIPITPIHSPNILYIYMPNLKIKM
ncbi:MAG: hypothetical protein K6E32_05545 [Lachnospiraceae bacterium]|nr:hypothetical protein [Lachnospiraceae bacterium]